MGFTESQLKTLEHVMGPLGFVFGAAMVLSGVSVARDIYERKSVGGYNYYPYVVQMCCTALWVTYSILDYQGGKMFWPLAVNGFAVSVSSAVFATYCSFATQKERDEIRWQAGAPLATVGCFCLLAFSNPTELVTSFAGTACLVSNILMYTGPLAGVRRAWAQQSTEFLPLSLGVTTLTCSLPWCFFGFAIWNPPIFVPNVFGIAFGTAQILVYVRLASRAARSEVEMGASTPFTSARV